MESTMGTGPFLAHLETDLPPTSHDRHTIVERKRAGCPRQMDMTRVLVIEDEADLREVLDYNLTKEGHRVSLVSTGAEGLRAARDQQPDLILLDLMLPDTTGTAVCKTLKKDPVTRDIRVIMVTAKGEEIDRVVGFA